MDGHRNPIACLGRRGDLERVRPGAVLVDLVDYGVDLTVGPDLCDRKVEATESASSP